jgi:hypothetical protein
MKTTRILAIASMTFSTGALVSLLITQDFVIALSFIGCALVVEFTAFIQSN